MRTRMLAACLSLALTACDTETVEPSTGPGSLEDVQAALAALPSAQVLGAHEDGVPYMIRGRFGTSASALRGVSASEAHTHVSSALSRLTPVFRLNTSDLVVRRLSQDEQGHTHIRYEQTKNGLPVVGHELVVHVDESGLVYAVNGSARDGESVPFRARIAPEAARAAALESTPGTVHAGEAPRLVYVRSSADGRLKLVFEVLVTGEDGDQPIRDHVFVNALDGTIEERTTDIHEARNRLVYSANNTTTLPGTLRISEGGITTGDPVVDKAYANLGTFYDCFRANFNRDSHNNAGAALTTTVHYSNNYVGAFWNGTTMVCGDGDGVTSGPLCNDMDVINHEYSHAIISAESNLTYANEPGALNEGLADIFAAYCESWSTAWSTGPDVFKIAEDVWTPATAGDAIRYLCDPALDGSSKDYYPDRYIGTADSGGVHANSGIANLAFCLLSKGGTHPRGKSATVVPSTGVQRAGAIFYKANSDLMTASTTFAQVKTYTEQAAAMLYGSGSAEQTAVTRAWEAVGVGLPVPPAPSTALTNGVALLNQSGASASQKFYHLDVPASRPVTFTLSGGTGDADLYVKFGSQPTTTSYGCRPYLGGNNETCNMAAQPTTGRYHVMLHGYSAYSGVSLTGTY
ncbi:Zn-dependent metalloprotease [Archangium gephyra]|uniref:Neutral metalloproteinase n=1 Tax=Archangium gephyra TaxID=48 RepID=A0AAC8QAJ8_9BACT|nr:M4 family metallopeptidase [Archangium gephyra]AKJ04117.1 Zinc metalloproteinase precursor/aureolysin [Archangium gephyra]REG37800.1 Zn-dependent metalloprotease [Archangium gephyra]